MEKICKKELDNPYHNIGEKYPDSKLVGSRAKLMMLDDFCAPKEEIKSMIEEILLLENILDCNKCEYPNECENCARAIEDR